MGNRKCCVHGNGASMPVVVLVCRAGQLVCVMIVGNTNGVQPSPIVLCVGLCSIVKGKLRKGRGHPRGPESEHVLILS